MRRLGGGPRATGLSAETGKRNSRWKPQAGVVRSTGRRESPQERKKRQTVERSCVGLLVNLPGRRFRANRGVTDRLGSKGAKPEILMDPKNRLLSIGSPKVQEAERFSIPYIGTNERFREATCRWGGACRSTTFRFPIYRITLGLYGLYGLPIEIKRKNRVHEGKSLGPPWTLAQNRCEPGRFHQILNPRTLLVPRTVRNLSGASDPGCTRSKQDAGLAWCRGTRSSAGRSRRGSAGISTFPGGQDERIPGKTKPISSV